MTEDRFDSRTAIGSPPAAGEELLGDPKIEELISGVVSCVKADLRADLLLLADALPPLLCLIFFLDVGCVVCSFARSEHFLIV